MPVDPESLAAFGDLAARWEPTDPEQPTTQRPHSDALTPAAPRDPLALLRTVDPATRQRVLALGAGSVLAGLVCGLLVPATADAAAPARATSSPAHAASSLTTLSLASASPFRGAAAGRPLAATGGSAAVPAVTPAAHGAVPVPRWVSPAHVAVLAAADAGPTLARARTAVAPKAAWHVTRALPASSGTGRRIVYAERSAHLWVVAADGTVLRDYKVTGRIDRPRAGTYRVWSKSEQTSNPKEKLTFDLMVRFARGYTGAPIGFHTIPRTYSGHPIQSESQLGTPVGRGGCVRQSRVDAAWLYSWVRVGDTVVVLR